MAAPDDDRSNEAPAATTARPNPPEKTALSNGNPIVSVKNVLNPPLPLELGGFIPYS
jgi:hypothetical protein